MTIWADADSLPREAKNLIARRASSAAGSLQEGGPSGGMAFRAVFVANKLTALPPGKNLLAVTVGAAGASTGGSPHAEAASTADDYILAAAKAGDILVTRDIPLAARAAAAGIITLNDRGALWTESELRERLSLRDHMASLRELGMASPSPRGRNYGPKDAKAFADALDKAITRSRSTGSTPDQRR
jgi:uncharacterized protein